MKVRRKLQIANIEAVKHGCEVLVHVCANLHRKDKVLIISDDFTWKVGQAITEVAQTVSAYVKHITIRPFTMHGQEPPTDVTKKMIESTVVFGVTKMSMAHSLACQKACSQGVRYLSLPDYSLNLLSSPALQVDFKKITPIVQWVTEFLSNGERVLLKTKLGTELWMHLDGRQANCCPGWCLEDGTFASPPDIESNIAPLEEKSEGVIIIDGSIPCEKLGLLKKPIKMEIKNGHITKIYGELANVLEEVLDHPQDPKTRILAELGFGLNPNARLQGVMLEDEGCLGTVHFGFGSNTLIGGKNQISFHLDMIARYPTVLVDGCTIFEEGRLITNYEL